MEEDFTADSEVADIITPDLDEQVLVLQKEYNALIVKYNTDMQTLNKILSTYEDELSSLKSQFHDLSFKFKQATQPPTRE